MMLNQSQTTGSGGGAGRSLGSILCAIGFVAALTGCAPAPGGVVVPQEAIQAFEGRSEKEIMPKVSPQAFISNFKQVCEANVNDLSKALRLLKSNGYILLAETREVVAYAHPEGKPVFGFGGSNPRRPELCMVMSRQSSKLRGATEAYANKLPNVLKIPIAGLAPGADKAWIPGDGAELLYLTVSQSDNILGPIYAFAVGKL